MHTHHLIMALCIQCHLPKMKEHLTAVYIGFKASKELMVLPERHVQHEFLSAVLLIVGTTTSKWYDVLTPSLCLHVWCCDILHGGDIAIGYVKFSCFSAQF